MSLNERVSVGTNERVRMLLLSAGRPSRRSSRADSRAGRQRSSSDQTSSVAGSGRQRSMSDQTDASVSPRTGRPRASSALNPLPLRTTAGAPGLVTFDTFNIEELGSVDAALSDAWGLIGKTLKVPNAAWSGLKGVNGHSSCEVVALDSTGQRYILSVDGQPRALSVRDIRAVLLLSTNLQ
eukprot:1026766-Prymnesium_polylepis.4